jgi:DNA-binding PadR family transcriptional regulator
VTVLQKRALLAAPENKWFIVSDLKGLGTSLGALGAAMRHIAKEGYLEKDWADREQRFNKRVWAYRLTDKGRKERARLRATERR